MSEGKKRRKKNPHEKLKKKAKTNKKTSSDAKTVTHHLPLAD